MTSNSHCDHNNTNDSLFDKEWSQTQKIFKKRYIFSYSENALFYTLTKTQPAFTCSKLTTENTKTRYEICSKLTINRLEQRQWRRSGVFVVNFEHISLFLLLLTLNM